MYISKLLYCFMLITIKFLYTYLIHDSVFLFMLLLSRYHAFHPHEPCASPSSASPSASLSFYICFMAADPHQKHKPEKTSCITANMRKAMPFFVMSGCSGRLSAVGWCHSSSVLNLAPQQYLRAVLPLNSIIASKMKKQTPTIEVREQYNPQQHYRTPILYIEIFFNKINRINYLTFI